MPASNFLPDSFIKVILTFITTFGILTTNVLANQDSIIWLETQSNQDGSYSSLADIATPYQSTAEVLRTLTILSPATNTDPGLQYLAVESYHSTENLSRKILALNDAGQDSAQLVIELSGMQNVDGGWGELYGYHSSAIDTAFALGVLANLNIAANAQIQSAIIYLLNQQQNDGGWRGGVNDSSVYETSLVISALSYYKNQYTGIKESIQAANNFLLTQQNSNGLWDSIFASVHALSALTQTITDISVLKSSISALEQIMLANSSWDNDVYITALAIRLLEAYQQRLVNPLAGLANGGIAGMVVLAGSDEPIAGVNITIKERPGVAVTSNAVGVFNFQSLEKGLYTLVFEKAGFSGVSAVVSVNNGEQTNTGKIALGISTGTGVLTGAVFDSLSMSAISNVQINITGPQNYVINTDQAGAFLISNMPSGAYTLNISATGYNSVSGTLDLIAGQTLSLKQGLTKQGAFLDNTPADLYGYVLDGKTGRPVSGASVRLDNGQSISTDVSGKFIFNSLPRLSYSVSVSATNYTTSSYSINFVAGSNGNVGNLNIYAGNALQAPTTLTLSGSVIEGVNNSAIAGAAVKLIETGDLVNTDQSGKFTLSNIVLKSFQLEVSATGYETRIYTITVNTFGEVAAEFILPPIVAPDPLVTSSTLTGVVTDNVSGLPVADADILINGVKSVKTNAQGEYTTSGINVLEFKLTTSAVNYSSTSINVTLSTHGSYTVNTKLEPVANQVNNIFQILNVVPVNNNVSANTKAQFNTEIANLTIQDQNTIILADIVDASGIILATVLPYAPNTTVQQGEFLFTSGEIKTLLFEWDVKQSLAESYQIIVRAVKTGSITQSNPKGSVLAEAGTYISVQPTKLISGTTSFDPPLVQAGTTTPVKLQALIINNGNVDLLNTGFTYSIIDPDSSTIIHTVQTTIDSLKVLNNQLVSFGDWLPTKSGNLQISIIPIDNTLAGSINGVLYVGDKATGTFTVDKQNVPEGTQTVRGKINLQGVDTKTGSSTDPLFFAVKNAVEKGGSFVGVQAISWHKRNQCLGCHIQTQSAMGLAASLGKANISKENTLYMFNTLTSSLVQNGGIYRSHPGFGKTATSLAVWSLREWSNKTESYNTMYEALRYMFDRKITNATETYWTQDHNTGYVSNVNNITALVAMGLSDVLKTQSTSTIDLIKGYSLGQGQALGTTARPLDMEFASDGFLYVTKFNGAVDKVNVTTNEVTTVVSGLPGNSYGIAVANDGTLFISGNQYLMRVDPDGTKQTILTSNGIFTDVDLGPDGLLYVSDYTNNRILRVTTTGQSEILASNGLIRNPYSIAFDSTGSVIIANFNKKILKMTPDNIISVVADDMAIRSLWVEVDADDTIYASTITPNGLYKINKSGAVERILYNVDSLRGIAVNQSTGRVYVSNETRNTYQELIIGNANQSLIATYKADLPKIVRYFLNRYTDNTSDNGIQALRMSALAEARAVITDPALLLEMDTAIDFAENLLRSRQRVDGGWPRSTGRTSDPLVTAMVGMALDYTNPSADDPMVRSTIQYLLNTQLSDGSWNNNNSYFSTRLAATSFVMAYMPKALDRLGGIDVDLTLDIPGNISISNATIPETSVTPIANGNRYFWSLTGVTSNTRVIEFDITLDNMVLNEQRPVATTTYMEFNNSFNNDRVRVDLDIPIVTATSELSLKVASNKLAYAANEDVLITPIVSNTSPVTDSATVQLSIRASGSTDDLVTLTPVSTGNIVSGGSVSLSGLWNTGAQYVGAYEVYAKLIDSQGRVVSETISPFSILSNGVAVNSTVTTDRPIYNAWDTVSINGRIRNISSNVIQPNTHIELIVKDPAGQTLYFDTIKMGELTPGALRDLPFTLILSDAVAGNYAVELIVKDDYTRNTLTSSVTQFMVQRTTLQSLTGVMDATPRQVFQGDPTICKDTLTNRSSTGVTGIKVTRQVISVATSQVISNQSVLQDIATGPIPTNIQSIETGNLDIGQYLCVLSASINEVSVNLAAAGFEVLEPPIRIDTLLGQGSQGRLLILMDNESHHDDDEDEDHNKYDGDESDDDQGEHDSHEPRNIPTIAAQRVFLEAQLKSAGWSYKIVTNNDEFTYEMRSNGYVAYALFNEHEELEEHVQQELRERVYNGEGLLVADSHDERNEYLDAALGIKHTGEDHEIASITFKDSALSLNGEQLLAYKDKVQRSELNGAEVVAEFTLKEQQHEDGDHKKDDGQDHEREYEKNDDEEDEHHQYSKAAVTSYDFGLGRSVYVAFDLLAQATAIQDNNILDDLLKLALVYTHPLDLNILPVNVLPVQLKLTNKGIATPGQVVVTLPQGVQIVDSAGASINLQGQLVLPFMLEEDAEFSARFWVRLSAISGTYTFTASVQTGIGQDLKEYEVISLNLVRPSFAELTEAQTALDGISGGDKYISKAQKYLQKAVKYLQQNKIKDVVKNMIKATDELARSSHPQLQAIRVMIDHNITRYAAILPVEMDDDDEAEDNEKDKEND